MGRNRKKTKHLPPRMQLKGKNYYWTPFVNGKMKWHPLGNDYVQAMLKWAEHEGISDGASSVNQMLDRALGIMATTVKASSFKELNRACQNLKPAFEGFRPAQVTPQHIAQYLEKRSAKVSANREITFLSGAWEVARRRGWIRLPNPCTGVRRNREKQRKRVAKPAEIQLLLARDGVMRDMIEITLMTALRESDVLNLQLTAAEPEGLRVKPRKTETTTEAELLFLWTPELRTLFERAKARRRRRGSPYLFPVTRGKRAGQA